MPETTLHFASSLDAGLAAVGEPALRVALTSGGDDRLGIDPRSGRNALGFAATPVSAETSFASATGSPISRRGYAAAEAAFQRLLGGGSRTGVDWAEGLRERLLDLYGVPGADAILAASPADAKLIVLALARTLLARPLASLIVGGGEAEPGLLLAAAGRHPANTTPFGVAVVRGEPVDGAGPDDGLVDTVAIRAADGAPLDFEAVDLMVLRKAQAALQAGRDLLVHALDTSATGLTGFSRSTAEALQASAAGRCLVVIDAGQLRCSAASIRRDLAAGFMVTIGGSTFAGGPCFAAAVLLPPTLMTMLGRAKRPAGLAAVSALNDWPARLRPQLRSVLPTALNIGLGLRWEAALAALEAVEVIDPGLRAAIVARFQAEVGRQVAASEGIVMLPAGDDTADRPRTIVPLLTLDVAGAPLPADLLHAALMAPGPGEGAQARVFHVGQPVEAGPASVLTVSLAAPQIRDVAARAATMSLDAAMTPLAADIAGLFAKWAALRTAAIAAGVPAQRRA